MDKGRLSLQVLNVATTWLVKSCMCHQRKVCNFSRQYSYD